MVGELSDPPAEVIIHQALYGYDRGHQLLASSIAIPPDLQLRLLSMTDPNIEDPESSGQLTGSPLNQSWYALIQSWPAGEVSRPGAVWSHVLLIPAASLVDISNAAALLGLFHRPSGVLGGGLDLIPYRQIRRAVDARESGGSVPSLSDAAYVVERMYSSNEAVVIPVRDPSQWRAFTFSAWSQQWTQLRLRFSFSIGSVQDSATSSAFDLQVVADSNNGKIPTRDRRAHSQPSMWSEIVASDTLSPQSRFRRLIGRYGEYLPAERTSFARLARVLTSVYDGPATSTDGIRKLIRECDDALSPTSSTVLRRAIAGRSDEIDPEITSAGESTVLVAIVEADPKSLDFANDGLDERFVDWWSNDPKSAFETFVRPPEGRMESRFINVSVRRAKPAIIGHLRRLDSGSIISLVERSPELAASVELWHAVGPESPRMAGVVANRGRRREFVQRVVAAAVAGGAVGVADIFVRSWDSVAASAGLHASVGMASFEEWIRSAEAAPNLIPELVLNSHVPEKAVARWIDDGALDAAEVIGKVDLSRLESIANAVRHRNVQQILWANVFRAGLDSPPSAPSTSFTDAFVNLHEAAADDVLEPSAWRAVEHGLVSPRRFWDWDRCDRLRRTWVRAVVRHPDARESIRFAVDHIRYPYDILDELGKSASGRQLVQKDSSQS